MRNKLLAGIGAGMLALTLSTSAHAATETLSENLPVPITVDSSQTVRDFTSTAAGTVSDVTVMVDFMAHDRGDCALPTSGSFANSGELSIQLVSPAGTVVYLVHSWATAQSGQGSYPNYSAAPSRVQVIFDDSAATAVGTTDNEAPVTGTFRPAEPLSAFQGEDAAGVWRLVFVDAAFLQAKCYYGASLMFETEVQPAPTPPTPPAPPAPTPPAKVETAAL